MTACRIALLALVAAALGAGCGQSGASRCVEDPGSAPIDVSGGDRRDPAVAGNDRGRIVAVWEATTGGPVEAAASDDGLRWSAPVAISEPGARDPQVAVDASGSAVAVWQGFDDENRRVARTATLRGGVWSTPVTISNAAGVQEPRVGLDGRGRATVAWRRDVGRRGDAVLELVERPAGEEWSTPSSFPRLGRRARRPRLEVAGSGAAALVWQERIDGRRAILTASRDPGGGWSPEAVLSGLDEDGFDADASVNDAGKAAAIWIAADDDGARVNVAERKPGGVWDASAELGRGEARPRELARPGRAQSEPDVRVARNGDVAAVWALARGDVNDVAGANREGSGDWARVRLGREGRPAGGARVVFAGGAPVAVWEELDQVFRVRTARLDPTRPVPVCRDLSAARHDAGGLQIVSGAPALAVWVDVNRGRIQASRIPAP